MFFARGDLGAPWNSSGIDGTVRWLRRIWAAIVEPGEGTTASEEVIRSLRRKVHKLCEQ